MVQVLVLVWVAFFKAALKAAVQVLVLVVVRVAFFKAALKKATQTRTRH